MAQPIRMFPRALSPRWLALRPRQWQNPRRGVATAAATVEGPEPVPFASTTSRRDTIRRAKPFSDFLTDTYAREHDYLRISLTERCNLRCLYCMPEEGIQLSPNRELLTTAEIYYLSALFVNQGVSKIRLTGGEPTVRKDIVPLMHQIGSLRKNGLKELALTTNGISLHRKLDEMVKAGLTGVNISLDTLDPFQFQLLTRRAGFNAVMKSIDRVKEMNRLGAGIKLKINCVVMRGLNDHQVLPFVEMTQNEDIEVRFIEYMPFGGNKWSENKMFSYSDMLDLIRTKYPEISRMKDAKNDTSKTWQVPGFVGRVGFITSMTHNFCGTCNRLRITSDGNLKVCLHGEAEVSLRDMLRKDHGGDPLDEEAFEAIRQLELDHRRARPEGEIGWMSKEQQLLEVIGRAVKKKEEGHAGMGELENMKNRPMILIDERARPHSRSKHYRQRHFASSITPWAKVPAHLLNPAPFSPLQIRHYSDERPSGFGFQSLSGLFSQAVSRGRYSRPRQRQEDVQKAQKQEPEQVTSGEKLPGAPFFSATSLTPDQEDARQTQASGRPSAQDVGKFDTTDTQQRSEKQARSGEIGANSWPTFASKSPAVLEDSTEIADNRTKEFYSSRAARQARPRTGIAPKTPSPTLPQENARNVRPGSVVIRKTVNSYGRPWQEGPRTRDEAREGYAEKVNRTTVHSVDGIPNSIAVGSQPAENPATGEDRLRTEFSSQTPKPSSSSSSPEHAERSRMGRGVRHRSAGTREDAHARYVNGIRTPNPFTFQTVTPIPADIENAEQSSQKAWGLSAEDRSTIDSILDPANSEAAGSEPAAEQTAEHSVRNPPPDDLGKSVTKGKSLTHVNGSGEAHMVDVGAKESTRRVAMATSYVTFTNPEPEKLIAENSNKKGDVLGSARIAGLMAAKRTSDLIPLCHPLAITKAEVDLRLETTPFLGGNGRVFIFTRVECVGPTGVEMEALTAATGAALTIYDMCKAVDREMMIGSTRLVYKSGGRSGTFVEEGWRNRRRGAEYLKEHGLEDPHAAEKE